MIPFPSCVLVANQEKKKIYRPRETNKQTREKKPNNKFTIIQSSPYSLSYNLSISYVLVIWSYFFFPLWLTSSSRPYGLLCTVVPSSLHHVFSLRVIYSQLDSLGKFQFKKKKGNFIFNTRHIGTKRFDLIQFSPTPSSECVLQIKLNAYIRMDCVPCYSV